MANWKAWCGAGLVGFALLFLTKNSTFPGWWALLPVVGTALLLSAGQAAWLNRVVLSQQALVWVGLISYPLYLWHWPLLVYARMEAGEQLSPGAGLLVVSLSVVLAWLTYRFVELPIRRKRPGALSVSTLSLLMLLMACCSVSVGLSNLPTIRHWTERSLEMKELDLVYTPNPSGNCPAVLSAEKQAFSFCASSGKGKPTAAVFGDSHADRLYSGLSQLDKSTSWLEIGKTSCPPVSGVDVEVSSSRGCAQMSRKAIAFLDASPRIKTVVLAFFGDYVLFGPERMVLRSTVFPTKNGTELLYLGLKRTVQTLEKHGKHVVIVIDVPVLPWQPQRCLGKTAKAVPGSVCYFAVAKAEKRQRVLRALLHKIAVALPATNFYDTFNVLCNKRTCRLETKTISIYQDTHHLSKRGSAYVAKDFLPWLSRTELSWRRPVLIGTKKKTASKVRNRHKLIL